MRTPRALLLALVLPAAALATARAALAGEADRWLPESTAVYVSVEDVRATSERFASHPLKSLWDDPKMQRFLEGPLGKLREVMEQAASEAGGASPADLLGIVQGQVVLAATGLREAEGGVRRVGVLLLAHVGDGEPRLAEWIAKAEPALLEKGLRRLEDEFRGTRIVRYEPKEPPPAKAGIAAGPLSWFLADGLWGVSTDPEALKDVLVRKAGGEETSLATNAAYRRVREVVGSGDLFVYVSTSRIWEVARRLVGEERSGSEVFRILEALGLDALRAVGFRASLTAQGVEARGFALATPPHRGLLKLVDAENSAIQIPRFVPADVESAAVMTLDLQAVWKEARRVMDRIEPGLTAELDKTFAELKAQKEIDVEAEVLGSLGKTLTVYQHSAGPQAKVVRKPTPGEETFGEDDEEEEDVPAPPTQRAVFALELSNPAALSRAIGKLLPEMGTGLVAQDYMGTSLWLPEEGSRFPISAGVVGNHLVIATNPDDLKHVVRVQGQAEAGSLVASPDFKRAMEGLPAARMGLSYSDPRRSMDDVSNALGLLAAMPMEIDWLNLNLFPADLIKSYVDVGGSAVVRESDGFSFVSIGRIKKP